MKKVKFIGVVIAILLVGVISFLKINNVFTKQERIKQNSTNENNQTINDTNSNLVYIDKDKLMEIIEDLEDGVYVEEQTLKEIDLKKDKWLWPTSDGYIITSRVGYRWGKLHTGLDISGGNFFGTPVYASLSGLVTKINDSCDDFGSYGNNCGDGDGNYLEIETEKGYKIFYSHLKNKIKVNVGDKIKKGDIIGYIGNSGSSTGTHLHFEIRDADNGVLNPCDIFNC